MSSPYGQDYEEPFDPGPEDNPTLAPERSDVRSRMVPGGSFVLDAPDKVPAVWGRGEEVLWAEGESLIIAGSPGVGKTTLAGQLVRARLIGGDVLGLPVEKTASRVLYLAMDRPRQIARALHRILGDLRREFLDEHLQFWPGPPVVDIAKRPETLLGYAQLAGADTIIVDSLKDAAIGLSEDDVGAGYNRARQMCTAAGVDVLELHHLIKRGANGAKPTALADLYGSTWLSAGAGSVILLAGDAGDPIVELKHLKMPSSEVGPLRVIHDHGAGTSSIWHATDLMMVARARGASGLTAKAAATTLFSVAKPTPAQVEKARRRLDALVRTDQLVFVEGDKTTSRPAVWVFVDPITNPFTDPFGGVDHHAAPEPSRSMLTDPITEPFTGITPPTHHVSTPLYRGGGTGSDSLDKHCTGCGQELDELRARYYDTCTRCDVVTDTTPKEAS